MLVTNGKIITWGNPNEILTGQALWIENGLIAEVGPEVELIAHHPHAERLDARGQLVMPGNICAHTHFYGAFSRGMGIPGAPAKDFPEILAKLWWSLDKALSLEDVKASAEVCLIDAIRHGTTTLIDHHASPNAIEGSLFAIAGAAETAGVRLSTCYEVTDRDGAERSAAGIRENVDFIRAVQSKGAENHTLAAMFGLHASLTLDEATLDACRQSIPSGAGFHIHVAEHSVDEYDSLAKSGQRVVDRLERRGILGPRSIAVHCVHIDAKEIEILANTQTWVTHQPRSNMNNAVGLPAVEAMMRAGVRVGLGNDGFSNTMWQEWKTAYLAHKLINLDPRRMGGYDVIKMAIENNSALATQQFNLPIGCVAPGAAADLILVEYDPFTELTAGNLPWHILFGFQESMISTTIVAGKILMKDRQLLTLDEERIAANARQLSKKTWERYLTYAA